jgi:hypothetical protein
MKKLLAFSMLLLAVALSVVTASPIPLLFQLPKANVIGLSDADLSAITTYAEQNQLPLIASLVNGLDIANDIMVHPGVKNKIPMPKLKIGPGFRPYSGTEQFKVNSAKYTDRHLEVKVGKREIEVDPEDYRGTYLAWATSPGSPATKKEIPFAQFFWEQVIRELQREINDETAYHGFDTTGIVAWDNGTTYSIGDIVLFASSTNNPNSVQDYYMAIAATNAAESPDTHPAKWRYVTARAVAPGIESYILAGITAAEISPVTTGAIDATPGVAIAAFNELFRSFNSAYRNNGIIISCSQTDMDFLIDDLLDKYSKYTRDDLSNAPYIVLPNSNGKCVVKVATWLGTSRRLIAGPYVPSDPGRHMNLWMATDQLSDVNSLRVNTESNLWTIKAGIKVALGFNYQDPEAIKVGDQS